MLKKELLTNLLGEDMRPKNELDHSIPATVDESKDNGRRADADYGSVDGALAMQYLSNWSTLRMTATWGN